MAKWRPSRIHTKAQKARVQLDKNIAKALDGKPYQMRGISSIKSKNSQKMLREAVKMAAGSGLTVGEFKKAFGIGKRYGLAGKNPNANKRKLAKGAAKVKLVKDVMATTKAGKNGHGSADTLGDPLLDMIGQLGYSPEEIDLAKLNEALGKAELEKSGTDMQTVLQKRYEAAFGWVALWLADNIDKYLLTY